MYLSSIRTGQIFFEISYGYAQKFIAMEDPHLDEGKMWRLKALDMMTLRELVFAVSDDAQHYLRLEPEQFFGPRPGFALEWAESNVTH